MKKQSPLQNSKRREANMKRTVKRQLQKVKPGISGGYKLRSGC